MKDELDKQLCEKYPKIFKDRYAPMTETCMCWGFDIGDGFVADVSNTEKTQRIVQEWRKFKQRDLRRQIQELEAQWEEFTGWKYLKENTELTS